MIEVGFAIILGFAIASSLFGLFEDWSREDKILLKALGCLVVLAGAIALSTLGHFSIREFIVTSFTLNWMWMLLGAFLSLGLQLITEGHLRDLWIKLHPQSVPTPEAQMGKRAQVSGFRREITPATLVGTSTQYLSKELDLRTETLIRLCYSVFEDRSAFMMSRLESSLRLGTGQRQKAFHKIVAGHRGRPKAKRIVHRYWRSVNGSSRMSQSLFGDLCHLARETNNRDRATVDRLSEVGIALGMSPEDMGKAIRAAL